MSQSKLEFDSKAASEEAWRRSGNINSNKLKDAHQKITETTWFEAGARFQFERDKLAHAQLLAAANEMAKALELCHRRMKMTAWIENECFEKTEEALEKFEDFKKAGGK